MLEANQAYYQSCFVNGSFALYKKYDFISNFSDLDIGFIHCSTYAKSKSYTKLKNMTDSVYEQLKKINGINLKFYKRYNDMRIFESYFTSNNGYYTNCIFDANVIPYDFYRDTDFLVQENKTTIERYLRIPFLSLPSEYHFPNYTTQFLTPNGDIATLLLQILFQKGNNAKKELAIKKINYVYNKVKNHRDFQEFEDIFTRFLLRNISFLYMLNRFSEIEYIQNMSIDTSNLLPMLPTELASQLFDAIENPNSIFSEIYYEICNTPLENTFKKSTELVDKIKIKK